MKPVWSAEAIDDLIALRAYIADVDNAAAQRIALRIIDTVEKLLSENADIGRPGRVPGTRELVIREDAFHCPLSPARGGSPNFARPPRRAPLARALLIGANAHPGLAAAAF